MLTSIVVLLHDSVCLLEHFNMELFDHAPYNPDLILNDYNLFIIYLKNWLQIPCFSSIELMDDVKTWLRSHATDFFDASIQILISWYNKFPISSGDYSDK
jgi:hypothetical protein